MPHFSLFILFFMFSNQHSTTTNSFMHCISHLLLDKKNTQNNDLRQHSLLSHDFCGQESACGLAGASGSGSLPDCSQHQLRLSSHWRFSGGRIYHQTHSCACWQTLVPWVLLNSRCQLLTGCFLEATLSSLPQSLLSRAEMSLSLNYCHKSQIATCFIRVRKQKRANVGVYSGSHSL